MHSDQTRKYGISESKIQALIITLLPTVVIIIRLVIWIQRWTCAQKRRLGLEKSIIIYFLSDMHIIITILYTIYLFNSSSILSLIVQWIQTEVYRVINL